jgi:hypothetical protein
MGPSSLGYAHIVKGTAAGLCLLICLLMDDREFG